jgi:hypothetical protein
MAVLLGNPKSDVFKNADLYKMSVVMEYALKQGYKNFDNGINPPLKLKEILETYPHEYFNQLNVVKVIKHKDKTLTIVYSNKFDKKFKIKIY